MGYLDNSGDILLDAVLTDAGRARLAKGDGSFRIVKFALGDDEIDYSLYQVNANTGYEDLRILKLPIFEAFTNNTSTLNSKLLTYSNNTSLLYLPVIQVVTALGVLDLVLLIMVILQASMQRPMPLWTRLQVLKRQLILPSDDVGLLKTYGQGDAGGNNIIVYDQGIDSDASLDWLGNTQPDLVEQQYIIEMDSRLLQVITPAGGQTASPSFVDDDSIASYFFSLSNTPDYFGAQANGPNVSNGALAGNYSLSFNDNNGVNTINSRKGIGTTDSTGLLGTRLVFGLKTTNTVASQAVTEGLWTSLGKQEGISFDGATTTTFATINTVVRITGVTTGYRTDVPVKVLKNV
jgi:hypothetical protein